MPLDIVVGTQWGDEGKGRIVDLLAAEAEIVARYNGGDNAGHTVTVGDQTFKLHVIPSGIIHPHTLSVIGNGVVVNPATLIQEIEALEAAGHSITPQRFQLSYAAHLITPAHLALDHAQEAARGKEKIGTTLRGIGPAYTSKVSRQGVRAYDLLDESRLSNSLAKHITEINRILVSIYDAKPLVIDEIQAQFHVYAEKLTPFIGNVSQILSEAVIRGTRILAEGAQGTLLDLDHGSYPFVTSSNPTAPGALVGLGLGINCVERVYGVTKSFQTRVGAGPLPTEVFDDLAVRLRGTGTQPWDEFGTTTGRPRRVGWLDTVLLRYARQINGLTDLALTKLDILSGLDSIQLCITYQRSGTRYTHLPYGPVDLEAYQPVYETLPGWEEDISGIRTWEDLPGAARAFILRIEELVDVPVRLVSVGPERDQVIEIS